MTLRLKFIVALLGTSLAAIALVGGVSRWVLMREFTQIAAEEFFSRFRLQATAYISTYGSLEKALEQESFREFRGRLDALEGHNPGGPFGGGLPSGARPFGRPTPGMRPAFGHPGVGGPGMRFAGGPPPGMGGPGRPFPPRPGGMGHPFPGPGGRGVWMGPNGFGPLGGPGRAMGFGPPPGLQRGGRPLPTPLPQGMRQAPIPPYEFLLVDLDGKVVFADGDYPLGKVIPEELRAKARPIVVNGKVAAWGVPLALRHLGKLDTAYLSAINEGLLYGLVAAGVLALSLGIVLGSRLCGDLSQLTTAIRAVGDGQLKQQVPIKSRDEIGMLASAFNRMSADLARTHDDLHRTTEQIREYAHRLKELAIRDGLTQLYNRRHFDEHSQGLFAQALRYRRPLTFMLGDIDHFKRINDRFSHAVGDEVLRRVSALIQSHLRESDMVARYGGEEFAIAFPDTSGGQAAAACEKLRRVIETYPWHQVHPDLRVTMSIGLCDELHLGSFEKMLGTADVRLYQAKEAGRNQVCFTE